VADQDDVVEVLDLHQVDDVGEVGVEVDLGTGKVRAFSQPGEGHRVDVVAVLPQLAGHRPPCQPPSGHATAAPGSGPA
jgi:hypothetical protein